MNLYNLSDNLIDYLSVYLTISDLFHMKEVSKRFNHVTVNKSQMLKAYFYITELCRNEKCDNLENLLETKLFSNRKIEMIISEKFNNNLSNSQIFHLIQYIIIHYSKGIKFLNIKVSNKLNWIYLKLLFSSNKTLIKTIYLVPQFLEDERNEGSQLIADIMKMNSIIDNIVLSYNYIVADGVKLIAKALEVNYRVQYIYLNGNNIGVDGAKYMAGSLKINSTILEIHLTDNKIGDEGVRYLSEALEVNATIIHIRLASNDIKAEGARYIAKALQKNKSLEIINIVNNKIGDEGAKYLAESFKINCTLEVFYLRSNNIQTEGVKFISEALLASQSKLHVIGLINN